MITYIKSTDEKVRQDILKIHGDAMQWTHLHFNILLKWLHRYCTHTELYLFICYFYVCYHPCFNIIRCNDN